MHCCGEVRWFGRRHRPSRTPGDIGGAELGNCGPESFYELALFEVTSTPVGDDQTPATTVDPTRVISIGAAFTSLAWAVSYGPLGARIFGLKAC
jgi:hypothetical protein